MLLMSFKCNEFLNVCLDRFIKFGINGILSFIIYNVFLFIFIGRNGSILVDDWFLIIRKIKIVFEEDFG